ncbi:MAG TPA: hypothetical protein VHA77_18070 [Xanthobacteraceae bacterium]|jgi:hypothetical protein|nr:hypothetical protein [Xanthobacteraceae bacterium]
MMPEGSQTTTDKAGRVLPFTSRAQRAGDRMSSVHPTRSPVEDLDKYARGPMDDDYRHRMITNAIAFAVVVVLIFCGIWLADTMAQMRKSQDCVLSGKRNCAPIEVPVESR